MKKFFYIIIIIIVTYTVLIFIKPVIANQIADILWIRSFNENVIEIKKKIDYVSTKIPSKDEINSAYSWAKDKISDFKENIDTVREKAEWLKDIYGNAKDFIDTTGEKIESVRDSIDWFNKLENQIKEVTE